MQLMCKLVNVEAISFRNPCRHSFGSQTFDLCRTQKGNSKTTGSFSLAACVQQAWGGWDVQITLSCHSNSRLSWARIVAGGKPN